jgi:hypothetical protein
MGSSSGETDVLHYSDFTIDMDPYELVRSFTANTTLNKLLL